MLNSYRSIFTYLHTNRKLCLITSLIVAELIVFAVLNTEADSSYIQHVADTKVAYNSDFAFILFGNLLAMLQMIAFGTLPLGIGTVFGAYSVMTGLIGTGKFILPQVGATNMLLCILPHGVFEFTAIFMSVFLSALCSKTLTCAVWHLIRRRPVIRPFLTDAVTILKSIVLVLVPLITFSAAIEAMVSVRIAELVLR